MRFNSTKLVQLIQLLQPEEWQDFGKWLRSPWCNSNKKLSELYRLLNAYYPDFTDRKLTKEQLFAQLYPANTYDAKWMRNLMSALSVSLERFLMHKRLDQKTHFQQTFLQEEFLERRRKDWFFKSAHRMSEKLKNKAVKTWEDYLHLSLLHEKMHRHIDATERQQVEVEDFRQAQKYLDQFYALGKIRFLVEQKERGRIISDADFSNRSEALLEFLDLEQMPVAFQYYKRFIKSEWSYTKLRSYYLKHFQNYSKKDRQIMLLLLINKAVKNKIKGDNSTLEDIFELYQFGLQEDLFITNGEMSSVSFANIISVGNSLKAFDFVAAFVQNYATVLSKELREDAIDWANAHMAHHQGKEVLKALEFKLSQRRSDNTSFSIRTKILLLQMRFDHFLKHQVYDPFLIDFSLAFEKQLNRDRNFSNLRLLALKKFVQYTRRLYKLKVDLKLTKKTLRKLELDLQKEENIRAKKWLLSKIELLKSPL